MGASWQRPYHPGGGATGGGQDDAGSPAADHPARDDSIGALEVSPAFGCGGLARPIRSPHQYISAAGLLGGGRGRTAPEMIPGPRPSPHNVPCEVAEWPSGVLTRGVLRPGSRLVPSATQAVPS
jgi:hypothetical protein